MGGKIRQMRGHLVLYLLFLGCLALIAYSLTLLQQAYWQAGGPRRPLPVYAFPEHGCPPFDSSPRLSATPCPS